MDVLWEKFQRNSTSPYKSNWFSIKGFTCLFSYHSRIYWFLPGELKVFSQHIGKNKWLSQIRRKNPHELKCWSSFCVHYFLRYYLMMQHQPIVKRVNGVMSEHTGLISSYQLIITAASPNTGDKVKGSCPRATDRSHVYLDIAKTGYLFLFRWYEIKFSLNVDTPGAKWLKLSTVRHRLIVQHQLCRWETMTCRSIPINMVSKMCDYINAARN